MNKLQRYFKDHHNLTISNEINDVSTNLDGSTKNQIVFYRINPGNEELFVERLKAATPGLVIITKKVNIKTELSILVMDFESFEDTQQLILDIIFPIRKKPKIIGVTGTNGKTSVCFFGLQIANQCNINALSIGTIGVYGKNGELDSEHRTTTPSHIELQKIISVNEPELIFIELSSHALDQNRIKNLLLDAAIWTNFSQDHIDYHKDMNSYFNSKLKICNLLKPDGILFVNKDETKLISRLSNAGTKITTVDNLNPYVKENLLFSLEIYQKNFTVALESFISIYPQFSREIINRSKIVPPPGRFDIIKNNLTSFAVVDYAHTPDAINKILKDIKKSFPAFKLITVVGCGGNRDKTKRKPMGIAACSNSDQVIFTSDNPRFENPESILTDITEGLEYSNYQIIADRFTAIKNSVSHLKENEILLVLGKGHEKYQEINGVKHPFDDKLVIEHTIKELEEKNDID